MPESILKDLLKEYEHKRIIADTDLENKKEELYKLYPELQEIDNKLNTAAINSAKSILFSNRKEIVAELESQINILKNKKALLLQKIGIDSSYLEPNYECKICKDTGYITDGYNTTMCSCLKQKLFNIEYNKSNIGNLDKENFDTFNINVYSDIVDTEKYKSSSSPRQNIQIIRNIVDSFIQNFDNPDEKNLLFTGNTGLGKTFLSNCIAKKLLEKGKTVLYQTAPEMLDSIIDYRFGKPNSSKNFYSHLLDVDLLIIDDLGTETLNNLKFTELFNILNSRLLNQNKKITKTIISTNLTLQNLFATYDERIVSRIVGYYNICRFFGDDIRFQKK